MKYDFHTAEFVETTLGLHKIAVAGSDKDISWHELRRFVVSLSEKLGLLNIPPGHPVIIYGHKEAMFPAAILACIHSKITYIPVDIIYPVERIRKIAESTGAQLIINCSASDPGISFALEIDSALEIKANHPPAFKNSIYGDEKDPLQYIMFTSGSTGEPKGVQILRSSVLHFAKWACADFGFTADDVFLNQALFSFDVSLSDIIHAFSRGATLVLTSSRLFKEPEVFLDRLKKYNCSVWTSTPSFLYLFLRNENFTSLNLPALRTFFLMGEELPVSYCEIVKQNFTDCRILNGYGPTEATIITSLYELKDPDINKYKKIPIGAALSCSGLLIDENGELIIHGPHVSTGYFKDEALSAAKFFIYEGHRAFRTGDSAYCEEGLLFFKGRNDRQVKLNGFRIEPVEIDQALRRQDGITDAYTLDVSTNGRVSNLISFVIMQKESIPDTEKIKSMLKNTLPSYMIPSVIIAVEAFPLTTSYKTDKAALLEMLRKSDP